MTTPANLERRDLAAGVVGLVLVLSLLWSLREVLSPPLLLPLVLAVLWPIRNRAGVSQLMAGATVLTLFWLLRLYGGPLGPFVIALAGAYLVSPAVDALARRRVPRALAILLVTALPLAIIALLVATGGPQLWDQFTALASRIPRLAETLVSWFEDIRASVSHLRFLTREQRTWLGTLDASDVSGYLQQHADAILSHAVNWGLNATQQVGTVLGFLGYLVITPVVAFYLLHDWPTLVASLQNLVPPARRPTILGFVHEYDAALGRWIRGQLIEATVVAVLTTIGLALVGVPSAVLLGLINGVFNVIPFIGFTIALVPALIVGLSMDDPAGGLLRVAGVFVVVNLIDGNVTGPRFVGRSVGLPPVAMMLAMVIGGAVLGFVGFVLAVPLATLAKMIMERMVGRYKRSGFYQVGGEVSGER
jgi:predicted PurR-regulated permease PerM